MGLASHLQLFIYAKNVLFIHNHLQQSSDLEGEAVTAMTFSHLIYHNFTLFNIIRQNHQRSLFVVSKNDTIIEVDIESMNMVDTFKIKECLYSMVSDCEEHIFINQISEIDLLDHKMLWFCYFIPHSILTSPSPTNCMIPKNKIISSDLKWHKIGYSSNNVQHNTYTIKTKDHIFIGSFVDNSLLIQRTKLPNIFGKIDSTKDLFTPLANFYFEKNSKFLEAFETEHEVYFVVVEPVSAKSRSISDCFMASDSHVVYVTRLIRICKKDPGGVIDHNEYNFGTIAKADLVCSVGSGKDQFLYTRAVSASWSNSKLFVLFESQRNSPPGIVVCYFEIFAFNMVFDGPIRPPWIHTPSKRTDRAKENPLPKVCLLLDNGTLNDNDKMIASSLSVNGLYRDLSIFPVSMINIKNKNIKSLKAFPAGSTDSSNVLIFTVHRSVEIYMHMVNNDLCEITKYQLGGQEIVSQVSGFNLDNDILVFISTNQRLIKLKINNCEKFESKSKCLLDAPNICGWDSRTMTCTSLNDRVYIDHWERGTCKKGTSNAMWSQSQLCTINDQQISLKCICKYCTDETLCKKEPKVQITNCSGTVEIGKWSEWQDWSECSKETGFKKRKRKCLTKFNCVGNDEDNQRCYEFYKNDLHTSWTQWFSVSNTNIFNSFRAKCLVNKLATTPILETREMFCENSCLENSFKWSKWSNCMNQDIQYRLFNCSMLSQCPANKIQVQMCELTPQKVLSYTKDKEATYTTIHLVLATLVASIIWVFILIFVSIIILRYKLKPQKIAKKRKRHLYDRNTSRFKREFSVTSNDYTSSDIKSTIYDIDHADPTSSTSIGNMPSTSKNLYVPFPLITEELSHKVAL